MIEISSDTLIEINNNFKIKAGPGAGKTHWLTNHIRHVLQKSNRLNSVQKIACITYTNAASLTIEQRIPHSLHNVEVGTLHSFLYKFILKPYVHFIAEKFEIDISKIEGHDEPFCNSHITELWLNSHQIAAGLKHPYTANQLLKLPDNLKKLHNWLLGIRYEFNESNVEICADIANAFISKDGKRIFLNKNCITHLKNHLPKYKKILFSKGILFHDDVIYLSHKILEVKPELRKIIAEKFPYIFIDEFQDTTPIQSEIIKMIGQSGSTIGVIGDLAQSIYKFTGAAPEIFDKFSLPGIKEFCITKNARSTPEIIALLNFIRTDIKQETIKNSSEKPTLLIGKTIFDAIAHIETKIKITPKILARTNKETNQIKFNIDNNDPDLISTWEEIDSDKNRQKIVTQIILALEFAKSLNFKDSIKSLKRIKKYEREGNSPDNELFIILTIYEKHNQITNNFLIEILNIASHFYKFAIPRKSDIINFYSTTKYQSIACNLRIESDDTAITIHQSKGLEFPCVLLKLRNEKELDFLANPNINDNEEHRVYYVALSRAKSYLYLWIPMLENKRKAAFVNYMEICNL